MPCLIAALMLTVFALTIPAGAQHTNEKDSPCADVVITADLANCLAKAGNAADGQLNAAYKHLRERLDAADDQRLVAAQRLWVQYRDANCKAERDLYQGGTAASPTYLACLEAMTRARTRELSIMYVVKLK